MRTLTTYLLVFALLPIRLWADSPLTSTEFHRAYLDVPQVNEALRTHSLSAELYKFLAQESNPLDIRLAVCNALGWGRAHSAAFLSFSGHDTMPRFNPYNDSALEAARVIRSFRTQNQAVLFAYLLAMDHYLDEQRLEMAMTIAHVAAEAQNNNFSYAAIATLIRGNAILPYQHNWCQVYRLWARVVSPDEDLNTARMRPMAVQIISDYMNLYQDSCR